jgi:membrane fusion protein (multidrug efflux system)
MADEISGNHAFMEPALQQGELPHLHGRASPLARVGDDAVAQPPRAQSYSITAASQVGLPLQPAPRRGGLRRAVFLPLVLLAACGAGGYYGLDWFANGRFMVTTDDAYVRADTSIIAAKVAGYLTAVPVVDNASVKTGDLLATIDPGDYSLAVEAARNKFETQMSTITRIGEQCAAQTTVINQARAGVDSAEADARRAALELNRADKLQRGGFGTTQRSEQAQADHDRTQAAVASAQAALAGAQANLAVLEAQKTEAGKLSRELQTALDRAQRDIDFTQVRAPFDGVIGNRVAQYGQYVQPGSRLMALIPTGGAYVEANFKETQIDRLKPGQKALLSVDSLGGKTLEGVVESLSPASGSQYSLLPPENATGNFTKIVQRVPVRIRALPEVATAELLRPGVSVVVRVSTRDPDAPPSTFMGALGLTRN